MFKPKYKLTKKLLANISQIERLYGQLETLHIPQKIALNLERDNLVQSSYISNSIEGNPLSLAEVTNLLLDDRVPVNRDEKEVKNYFYLLQNLKKYLDKFSSLKTIKEIHRQLLMDVNNRIAGKIRNKKVVVGGYVNRKGKLEMQVKHEPPFHSQNKISEILTSLFTWLNENKEIPILIKTGVFHHQFVYIHPFEDGNGRVCRLLTALIFLKAGYLINKYFVLDDYYDIDRLQYSDKLHSADKGDKTEWLEYFSDGVKYSLQSALVKTKDALNNLGMEERLTPKEKEVLKIIQEKREITSGQLANKLKVSRQQAHNLLRSLVERGFLDKKGQTKASYYSLK